MSALRVLLSRYPPTPPPPSFTPLDSPPLFLHLYGTPLLCAYEHERCEWRRQRRRLLSRPTAAATVAAAGTFGIDAALAADEVDGPGN